MARDLEINPTSSAATGNAVLLRVDARTGEVRGVSTIARSYPPDLPTEERTFCLEADASQKAEYARLLKGGQRSVDRCDGRASADAIDALPDAVRLRPDIADKAKATPQAMTARRGK